MVRAPYSLTSHLIEITSIALYPLLTRLLYPTSFLVYMLAYLVGAILQWWELLHKFFYFQETLTRLKGILQSVTISAGLCYLSIDLLANAIISQNVLVFILAFSAFLGNFFRIYRNKIVKRLEKEVGAKLRS